MLHSFTVNILSIAIDAHVFFIFFDVFCFSFYVYLFSVLLAFLSERNQIIWFIF